MKKCIHIKILFAIVWLCCAAIIPANAAQPVNFTISAPPQVAVGERFRVVFSLNARPSDFQAPAFAGFRVLSGPSQSTSSSTQIVNSQVTTSYTISYNYVLEATQEGSFTINSAQAKVDGTSYSTESWNIRVSGQAPQSSAPSQQGPGSSRQPSSSQEQLSDKDIFVRTSVSRQNPFQGEQVIVTYKLYTRIPVSNYSINKLPSYQGFWSENLTSPSQPQASSEVIEGIQYSVVELRRIALFAQRSGELRIEPLEVECLVRTRSQQRSGSIFDDFFGGSVFGTFQNVPITLRSDAVTLQVKPLPAQNRPAAFKGLVGQFDISATLSPQNIPVNEAASLKLIINGKGNIRMMDTPGIQFPGNLEVFDPNIEDKISNELSGVSGSRAYDYLVIPRTGGEYEIPGIVLAYFDPAAGQYVTKTAGGFVLNATGAGTEQELSISRSDVQQISTDIRFINTRSVSLATRGLIFFRSRTFYILLVVPFLLFAATLILGNREIRIRRNAALMRNKKAEKQARKRLRQATVYMRNQSNHAFYDEIFKALWGYLADKLGIPLSRLNKEEVMKILQEKSISETLGRDFINVLNDAEFARFAPVSDTHQLQDMYERAIDVIIRLDREIRIKRV